MINRREFIRALAVIPAAALVPFAAAEPVFHTGGVVNRATVVPFLGEMPCTAMSLVDGTKMRPWAVDVVAPTAAKDAVAFGAVAACQVKPPVDRVHNLPLDDPQSTVRWVHAERELWLCHGADGCLWMPLLDGECKRRRMQK